MPHQDTLTDLLGAVSYAEYLVSNHFKSHQMRPDSGFCRACTDHDLALERAEAALRAFQSRAEAA